MIRIEDISVGAYKLRYLPGVLLVLLLGSCTAMDSEQGATGGGCRCRGGARNDGGCPCPAVDIGILIGRSDRGGIAPCAAHHFQRD